MWFVLALSLVVVVYNGLANRWPPFHGSVYVPLNLLFAATVTVAAITATETSWGGIVGDLEASGVALPLVLVIGFAVVVLTLARSRHGHRIADERVAEMRGGSLAWYVLVRIPVGTALVEELVFRGVLFTVWRGTGVSEVVAAICASVAFGLWHIQPTIDGLRMNDPSASRDKVTVVVVGAVLLTTIAGLGLTWLRAWSGGLLGPVLLHAGINSVGATAAALAHRRTEASSAHP